MRKFKEMHLMIKEGRVRVPIMYSIYEIVASPLCNSGKDLLLFTHQHQLHSRSMALSVN